MKNLFLTICAIVISGYWVFAQEETTSTSSSSSRLIHVAFSPSTSALIGVHGGLLGNSGGVLGGNGIVESGGVYLSARYNNQDFINLDRLSIDLGVSLQLVEMAHIFIGGGYGEYVYPYKEPAIIPEKEIKGYEIEGGTIIKVGKFTIHAGVSTLKFEHLDFFGGIGYTF
jgi:hypothetical protein